MRLQKFDITDFETFYPLLLDTFPKEELLPQEMHYRFFQRPHFYGRHYNHFSAFLIGFQLPTFFFVELYMVQSHLRNQGMGKQFLKAVMNEITTPIILEVELPTDDLSQRRIKFYESLGFHLNTYDYKMPQFNDHGGVPLYIMSYPKPLSKDEFEMVKNKIYQDVYEI